MDGSFGEMCVKVKVVSDLSCCTCPLENLVSAGNRLMPKVLTKIIGAKLKASKLL